MAGDGLSGGKHSVELLKYLLVQPDGEGCSKEIRPSRGDKGQEEPVMGICFTPGGRQLLFLEL